MLNGLLRILSLCLLISLSISFPILNSQGQQSTRPGSSESTFFGKEETKWRETRECPLPAILWQGVKEEPRVDSFRLGEDAIGPMRKMGPSTTVPGCAYSGRFTAGVTEALVGDKALYERGRYRYFERYYEDAIHYFRRLIKEYPDSAWMGPALYWMGEATFHQGKDDEAIFYFRKVVEKYPESEFYAFALYSCGWIQLRKEAYEEAHQFFYQVYGKNPSHPMAETSLFWSGHCLYSLKSYTETLQAMETLLKLYPEGKWRQEAETLL